MDADRKTDESAARAESLGMFNAYFVEIRSKIDGLVKQVLLISAGVQAITIGAFLSGSPPVLAPSAVDLFKLGWLALSISIVLCLSFMLAQIIGMITVGLRFKDKLKTGRTGAEIIEAPTPMRVVNWVVGLAAFASCAFGSMALSLAAMQLAGGLGGT
jgi:hypothetical protein